MRRLPTFVFGMIAGGLFVYAALHYHVIHADSGLHLVPKVSSTFSLTYIDIRNFGPADWVKRPEVASALLAADRPDLLESAAADALQTGLNAVSPSLGERR